MTDGGNDIRINRLFDRAMSAARVGPNKHELPVMNARDDDVSQ